MVSYTIYRTAYAHQPFCCSGYQLIGATTCNRKMNNAFLFCTDGSVFYLLFSTCLPQPYAIIVMQITHVQRQTAVCVLPVGLDLTAIQVHCKYRLKLTTLCTRVQFNLQHAGDRVSRESARKTKPYLEVQVCCFSIVQWYQVCCSRLSIVTLGDHTLRR